MDGGLEALDLNDESALLAKLIPGAVELTGSDSPYEKEEKLIGFSRGEIRVLVTKPKIGAWGLNWQHCNRMSFFPPTPTSSTTRPCAARGGSGSNDR